MFLNKNFALFSSLKRSLLQIALKLFGSTQKTWAALANEYLISLRDVMKSHVDMLDIKIYILSILAASNAEFQTTIGILEECKQNLQTLIKQCFVDKKKPQSVKDLKRQISKIHSEMRDAQRRLRLVLQFYKKSVRDVRGVEYLLYFYDENRNNPSVKLDIENINKTRVASEQISEKIF